MAPSALALLSRIESIRREYHTGVIQNFISFLGAKYVFLDTASCRACLMSRLRHGDNDIHPIDSEVPAAQNLAMHASDKAPNGNARQAQASALRGSTVDCTMLPSRVRGCLEEERFLAHEVPPHSLLTFSIKSPISSDLSAAIDAFMRSE